METDPHNVDAALVRAWNLYDLDDSDAVEAEIEALLPVLVKAGYVRIDDALNAWSFTQRGVKRAHALRH